MRMTEPIEVDFSKQFVYLRIETNHLVRVFSVSYDGENYKRIVILSNVYYLCDEGLKKGKRFTGAMVGMYAFAGEFGSKYTDEFGHHGTDDMHVEFDYFNYTPGYIS